MGCVWRLLDKLKRRQNYLTCIHGRTGPGALGRVEVLVASPSPGVRIPGRMLMRVLVEATAGYGDRVAGRHRAGVRGLGALHA